MKSSLVIDKKGLNEVNLRYIMRKGHALFTSSVRSASQLSLTLLIYSVMRSNSKSEQYTY
jgi:hypothetical protein